MIYYSDVANIPGWLAWQDFEIIKTVLEYQNNNERLACLEIGVHHGKSFITIAKFSGNRKLYAIDIFSDQSKNIDRSGRGDKHSFLSNLQDFDIELDRITIDERASSVVKSCTIINSVGKIDFFHIDGGHHYSAVRNDLSLALSTVSERGVISIDDTFRPEWPEVTSAVFSHTEFTNEFTMYAIGFNKTYWCRPHLKNKYQKILRINKNLSWFLQKTYSINGNKILIYQKYPLPEWPVRTLLAWVLSIYTPNFYIHTMRSAPFRFYVRCLRKIKRFSKSLTGR